MRVVFVHGACVRDGSWWWHLAAAALRERGIGSVAQALPSCGEVGRSAGPQGPGLPEDVAVVRAVLTEEDEPTVIYRLQARSSVDDRVSAAKIVITLDAQEPPSHQAAITFARPLPAQRPQWRVWR